MRAPVHDVDVVPPDELGAQSPVDGRVGVFDPAEGLVREHDAEAEGVVGGVALPQRDLAVGTEPLEQGRGVEPAGAAADDGDPQRGARASARGLAGIASGPAISGAASR